MAEQETARAATRFIDAYGGGGFRIAGESYRGSVLVLPDRTLAWPVVAIADMTRASLAALFEFTPPVEILLVGCGARMALIPPALRQELRAAGLVVDAMDTGAACRTYNVLRAEERRVAAALVAI
jgi:uncharacterized protein